MECKSIMILLFIIIFNRLETLLSLTWIAQVSEEEVFHTTWKWQNTTISVVPPPLLHLPTLKFECGVSSTFTIKPYWNHVIRTFVVLIIDVFLTYSELCMLIRPEIYKFKFWKLLQSPSWFWYTMYQTWLDVPSNCHNLLLYVFFHEL